MIRVCIPGLGALLASVLVFMGIAAAQDVISEPLDDLNDIQIQRMTDEEIEALERELLSDYDTIGATDVDDRTDELEPTPTREGVLSVGEQADPERGVLPEIDEDTLLRLQLDTDELRRLYEAMQADMAIPTLELDLDDCVRIALEANQDIQIVQFTPWKADMDIMSARGEFDPVVSGRINYIEAEQSTSAETVTFGGLPNIEIYRTDGNVAVGGKLRWGTTYNVGLDMSKEETTYNRFIEEWSGDLTFSLTQPLLRGRGSAVNLAVIRIAENARQQADEQVQLQVMNTIAEVIKAYWDVVGAAENIAVRRESLDNAERLLRINIQRREIGTAASIEVVQAQAGVASRQSELITAQSQMLDAGDRLKNLLNLRENDVLHRARIAPLDRPQMEEVYLDENESILRAYEHRPDVQMAEIAVQTAEIDQKRASNDLLPQLDVTGTVSQGHRGASASDVFDGIIDREDRSYSVGFQGSMPIRNRAARGSYQRSRLDKREAELQLEKARHDAMLAVRLAMRSVATNRILVENNRQARALQETNVQAEEERLRLGVSTSFEVLRIQEDLTTAQVQELQSIIAYEQALVDLRLAEGVLLDQLGVVYDTPAPDQEPPSMITSTVRAMFGREP